MYKQNHFEQEKKGKNMKSLLAIFLIGSSALAANLESPVSFNDAFHVKTLTLLSDYSLPTERVYTKDGYYDETYTIPAYARVSVLKAKHFEGQDVAGVVGVCILTLRYRDKIFELKTGAVVGKDPVEGTIAFLGCHGNLPEQFGIYHYYK